METQENTKKLEPFSLIYSNEVYDSLRTSKLTTGIFQLSSSKTAHFCHGYKKIDSEEQVIALNALLRPGTMDIELADGKSAAEHYLMRLNGEEEIVYLHPALEPILKDTYGIILYQESVLFIASQVAGFDLVKSDLMRQAIGKKDFVKMESMRKDFIEGCQVHSGVPADIATQIFEQIRASGRYSFNRCCSGREVIFRHNRGRHTFAPTIAEMYHIGHDIEYAKRTGHLDLYKKYKLKKYGRCHSLGQDERLYKNDIVDICYAGIRPVYRVTTENGYTIDVTNNHKFPTPRGERQLKSLRTGDELYICLFEPYIQETTTEKISNRQGYISNIPKKGQMGFQKKKVSLDNNLKRFKELHRGQPCKLCRRHHKRMEAHHKDGDHSNSVRTNLVWLCCSCHKKEHYKMGRVRQGEKGMNAHLSKIVSIECIGEEEVYDVEVSGEVSHTFLTAGGIVTSNSHATSYGTESCIDLWIRYYYPHLFFATKISYTMIGVSDKAKRNLLIKNLIRSAKERNIETTLPTLYRRNVHTDFSVIDNEIYLGFNCISGTGSDAFEKIFAKIEATETKRKQNILAHSWLKILLYFSKDIGKTAMESFISLGIFDSVDRNRQGLLYDYHDWLQISSSTVAAKWMEANQQKTLEETMKALLKHSPPKLQGEQLKKVQTVYELSLRNRPKVTPATWVLQQEESRLGITITQHRFKDSANVQEANVTLQDLDKPREGAKLAIYVTGVRLAKQKDGGDMMWLECVDQFGNQSGNVVMFAKQYNQYGDMIYENGSFLVEGTISDRSSFIINKVVHLDSSD